MPDTTIAIVGAGMAGLACATRLVASGFTVTLFDKGRGPGGRMSTRRVETRLGEAAFDHGAQYFTARHPAFIEQVRAWAELGIVGLWPAAGADAWVGVPAMNAPVRLMAEACGVHWSSRIDALERHQDGWKLRGAAPQQLRFDAVVIAVPAEQAGALFRAFDSGIAARADAAKAAPCWTVMAAFGDSIATAPDALRGQGPLAWAARNSAKPGRHGPEAWVLQATPEWSLRHIEDAAEDVVQVLLDCFSAEIDAELPKPVEAAAHRWRYARYGSAEGDSVPWNAELGVGACGDWLLGPRVECAWLSGVRLAEAIVGAGGRRLSSSKRVQGVA